jgi:hypothetical protein
MVGAPIDGEPRLHNVLADLILLGHLFIDHMNMPVYSARC